MVHGRLETTFCGGGGGGAALESSGLCSGTLQAQLQECQDGREREEDRRERESEAVGYSTPKDVNMNVMTYIHTTKSCGSSLVPPPGTGACSNMGTLHEHSTLLLCGNPHRHQCHKSTYLHSHCRSRSLSLTPPTYNAYHTTLKVWDMHDYTHQARRSRGGEAS